MRKLFATYFILLLLFLFKSSHVHAQTDTITTTVIVFNSEGSGDEGQKNVDNDRLLLKIDPLRALRGEVPLSLEYLFTTKLSLQLGLGFTFYDIMYEYSWNPELHDMPESRVKHHIGPTARIGIKYYPGGYGPEGFYIGGQYGFQKFNYSFNELDDNGVTLERRFETERIINEMVANAGYQGYISDNFYYDLYLDIGFANVEEVQVKLENEPPDFIGFQLVEGKEYYVIEEVQKENLALMIGIKLGYAF